MKSTIKKYLSGNSSEKEKNEFMTVPAYTSGIAMAAAMFIAAELPTTNGIKVGE